MSDFGKITVQNILGSFSISNFAEELDLGLLQNSCFQKIFKVYW